MPRAQIAARRSLGTLQPYCGTQSEGSNPKRDRLVCPLGSRTPLGVALALLCKRRWIGGSSRKEHLAACLPQVAERLA